MLFIGSLPTSVKSTGIHDLFLLLSRTTMKFNGLLLSLLFTQMSSTTVDTPSGRLVTVLPKDQLLPLFTQWGDKHVSD